MLALISVEHVARRYMAPFKASLISGPEADAAALI